MAKRNKEQRELLIKMKNDISAFIVNYNKRYKLFPWSQVNKITRLKINSQTPITVNGIKYTVKELVKLIATTKTKISCRLKPSYYTYLIRTFIKESKDKTGLELKKVYDVYDDELQCIFKEMNQDLMFCISALKELNKALKSKDIDVLDTNDSEIKESEDYTDMDNFDLLLEMMDIDDDGTLLDIMTESSLDDDDLFEEDGNLDARMRFVIAKADFKKDIKACGREIRRKDKVAALKELSKAQSAFKDIEKAIDGIDEDLGTAICGIVVEGLLEICETTLAMITGNILSGGNDKVARGFGNIINLYNDIKNLVGVIKSISDKGFSADAFNLYKNRLKMLAKQMEKQLDKLEKEVKKLPEPEKVEESVDDIDTELMLSLIESSLDDDDLFEEGGNLDARKKFIVAKADFKKAIKECKKEIKRKDKVAALKEFSKAKSAFKDIKKAIDGIDENLGTVICGNFFEGLIEMGEQLLAFITGAILSDGDAEVAGGATAAMKLYNGIKDLVGVIRSISEKGLSVDAFNSYKNKLKMIASNMEKQLDKLEKEVKKLSFKVKTESVDDIDTELMLSLIESSLDDDDDLFEEGTNIKATKIAHQMKKDIKNLTGEYKRNIKGAQFAKARKNVKEMKALLRYAQKEIDALDSNLVSTVLGVFANNLIYTLKLLAIALPGSVGLSAAMLAVKKGKESTATVIGSISGVTLGLSRIAAAVLEIKELIDVVIGIVKNIKKTGTATPDAFNLYKNKISTAMTATDKKLDKMLEHVDNVERAYKARIAELGKDDKLKKESVSVDEQRLAIYEACYRQCQKSQT